MRRISFPLAATALAMALLAGCAHGPKKIPPASVLYKQAQNALTVENWKAATSRLRQLLSTYPFGEYATQSRLDLIYAYYRSNQPDEVAKQSDEFVRENPASTYVPYALFMKGAGYANALQPGPLDVVFRTSLADRNPTDQQQAFSAFKQLLTRYPKSRYAIQARQWMVLVRDRLANYDLLVARFYVRRKNWVAAVDRASAVVTQYPATPSARPALEIMIKSYRALGEDKLADAAKQYYDYNFKGGNKTQGGATAH